MWFWQKRKKVGLALGSGGARGLAHVGVIKTLLKNEVPIDMIAGSSSGALIGGFFAATGRTEKIEEIVDGVTYKDLVGVLVDPSWGAGLIKGEKTEKFLRNYLGEKKIEELKTPFAAVATEVKTAEKVVFKKGDLVTAIRASISIPLVYEPFVKEGKILVDGGVSYPVPVEVVKEMGAEVVIAVNLDGVYFWQKDKGFKKYPSSIEVLKDSYFALRYNLAKKEIATAEAVIEPKMEYVSDFDFVQGKKAIEAGEAAAAEQMAKIKSLI